MRRVSRVGNLTLLCVGCHVSCGIVSVTWQSPHATLGRTSVRVLPFTYTCTYSDHIQHLIGAAKGEGQKSAPCTRRDAPRGSSVDRDAVGRGPTALQDVEDSVSV